MTALTGRSLQLLASTTQGSFASGRVLLSRALERYYDPLRLPPDTSPLPGDITGYRTSTLQGTFAVLGPGRASPVPAVTFSPFHAPYAGGFLDAARSGSSRLPWPSPNGTGLGSLSIHSRRGRLRFMLRTGESHDPKGRSSSRFDAGLSTDAGDQLPGSLTTTWTGLTPAGDSKLAHQANGITSHGPTGSGHTPGVC